MFEDIRDFLDDVVTALETRRNWRRFRAQLGFTSNAKMQAALEFTDFEIGRLVHPLPYPRWVMADLLKGKRGALMALFAETPEFFQYLIHDEWPQPSLEDYQKLARLMDEIRREKAEE